MSLVGDHDVNTMENYCLSLTITRARMSILRSLRHIISCHYKLWFLLDTSGQPVIHYTSTAVSRSDIQLWAYRATTRKKHKCKSD